MKVVSACSFSRTWATLYFTIVAPALVYLCKWIYWRLAGFFRMTLLYIGCNQFEPCKAVCSAASASFALSCALASLVVVVIPQWTAFRSCCGRVLWFRRRALSFMWILLWAVFLFVFIVPLHLAENFHTRQSSWHMLHSSVDFRKSVINTVVRNPGLLLWKPFREWTVVGILLTQDVFTLIVHRSIGICS